MEFQSRCSQRLLVALSRVETKAGTRQKLNLTESFCMKNFLFKDWVFMWRSARMKAMRPRRAKRTIAIKISAKNYWEQNIRNQ